mmetsp:Transcript_22870/g.67333  ORF Transcript_22870/g.67333 Transcript_22870/m.67333 type:complete len:149 (+) Transcript_22870:303-749(+)
MPVPEHTRPVDAPRHTPRGRAHRRRLRLLGWRALPVTTRVHRPHVSRGHTCATATLPECHPTLLSNATPSGSGFQFAPAIGEYLARLCTLRPASETTGAALVNTATADGLSMHIARHSAKMAKKFAIDRFGLSNESRVAGGPRDDRFE